MPNPLRSAFRFFHEHAGYSTPPGRAVCALALARAEAKADAVGLVFEWSDDDEPAEACTGRRIKDPKSGKMVDEYATYPAVVCAVYAADRDSDNAPRRYRLDFRPNPLASLGGIIESDDTRDRNTYRRIIEAELATEAFDSHYSAAWIGA